MESKKEMVIGFIGGSITMGAVATAPDRCYAYHVYSWFKSRYTDRIVTYVNAGIGATTSQYGVARCEEQLLSHSPDVIFIEFSVNDIDENKQWLFKETYEGLIRKCCSAKNAPLVILINNMFYDTGYNVQDMHNEIGKAYSVPIISLKDTLYKEIQAGVYEVGELTKDMLHPTDRGHKLVADKIIEFLTQLLQEENVITCRQRILPSAITNNRFEHSLLYNNTNFSPTMNGFIRDENEKGNINDLFKLGFYSKQPGAYLEFESEMESVSIQYRRTILGRTLKANVYVDEEYCCQLDGNFDEDWGELLALDYIKGNMSKGSHKVRIELVGDEEVEYDIPFYITGLIITKEEA